MSKEEITRKVIIGCVNRDCVRNGAAEVHARIRETIAKENLLVEWDTYKCFGACDYGPNVIIYPQLELYSNLTPEDVPALFARLNGGPVPAHLVAELDLESLQDVEEAKELIQEDYE
jgi:NADH:ubiquinone oxidoreductase subunit E